MPGASPDGQAVLRGDLGLSSLEHSGLRSTERGRVVPLRIEEWSKEALLWYFESLNGPKGVYALRKKVGDPSRFFAGRPSELSNITRGSKRGAGDKPRGSTAKRGAKRRSLASHGAIKSRQFQVGKGLTRREALAIAVRRSRRDHRGFSYNPKTGVAVLT